MYKVAKLNINDRNDLFTATAQKMNISEAIIEKDFWVCFTLNYLFHVCKWKDSFAFKGGTSLSKAYNLIERFCNCRCCIFFHFHSTLTTPTLCISIAASSSL